MAPIKRKLSRSVKRALQAALTGAAALTILTVDATATTVDGTLFTSDYEYPRAMADPAIAALFLPVMNLSKTAGLTNPGALATPTAGNCPGSTYNLPGKTVTWTSGTQTISDVNFDGWEVYVKGTANITFTNCKAKPPAGGLCMRYGETGYPTVWHYNCLFDLSGAGRVLEAPLYGNGDLYYRFCRFTNAPADFLSLGHLASSVFDLEDCYFTNIARDPLRAHIEIFHFYQGSIRLKRVFADFCDGVPADKGFGKSTSLGQNGGWTGMLFPEPTLGNITMDVDQCILRGASNEHLSAAYFGPSGDSVKFAKPNFNSQFNNKAYTLTTSFTNNLIDKGSSNYISKGTSTFNHSGNRDVFTGADIESQLP